MTAFEDRHDLFILTHNRPRQLADAIQSVLAELAKTSAHVFRLAVISSGKRPAPLPSPFEMIDRPGLKTAVSKRRFAMEQSSAAWVWLLDDDCRIGDGAIRAMLRVISGDLLENRAGAVYPNLIFTGDSPRAFRAAERAGLLAGMSGLYDANGRFRWGPSALVAVRRSAALEVDAFRPDTFNVPAGGEDVDMGRRMEKGGWERIFCPDATVFHGRDTWGTFRMNFRRAYAYGWAEAELIRVHPSDAVRSSPKSARAPRQRSDKTGLIDHVITVAYRWSYSCAYRIGRLHHAIRYLRPQSLTHRFDWAGTVGSK